MLYIRLFLSSHISLRILHIYLKRVCLKPDCQHKHLSRWKGVWTARAIWFLFIHERPIFLTTMMSQRPTLGNTLQKLQLIIFLLNVSGGIELTQISIAWKLIRSIKQHIQLKSPCAWYNIFTELYDYDKLCVPVNYFTKDKQKNSLTE